MVSFDPVALRHRLHETPERSHEEFATTSLISEVVRDLGIEILDYSLSTGLVAQITGGAGPTIALRADIDGLPVTEDPSHEPRSLTEGVMHACGHDLHIASLLGAAAHFAEHRSELPGSIRLLFQPAEETGNGSAEVIDAGALDGVSAVVGFHNNPNYAPGSIAIGEAMMAGCVRFGVTLHAQGTHGAYPEKGTGPIEALASIITALQTIPSRNISTFSPLVLSVTEVHGGDVWNVIPAQAGFSGTVRTFSTEVESQVEDRFRTLVEQIAAAFGIRAEISWERLARPLRNDPELLAIATATIPDYAELAELHPSMAGEDFAEYGAQAPLLFAFVGSHGGPGAADWHSPQLVGLDATISTATDFFIHTATAVISHFAQ